MDTKENIYIAGHKGMVGSAVVRCLQARGFFNLILRTSAELDLTRQSDVETMLAREKPDYVFLCAARVGGIMANATYRGDFIRVNLQIQTNVIDAAWKSGVKKLFFFSSSCVYPRLCPQPMNEQHLWTGPLESTNEPYAVAKLAGMAMCRAYNEQYKTSYISGLPTNLYGPNDNYDPKQSHLMAALISKFHNAKVAGLPEVKLWGTGTPRREVMYVDDAANAALFLMQNYSGDEPINIGVGVDFSIQELAKEVSSVIGYQGRIAYDPAYPDGAPRKLIDSSRLLDLGWQPQMPLRKGIVEAYQWYLENHVNSGEHSG